MPFTVPFDPGPSDQKVKPGDQPAPLPATFIPVFSKRYSAIQQTDASYNQYLIDTKYLTKTGMVGVPTDGAAQIVKLHDPFTKKIISWTAERMNAWPICPHWDDGDPNAVLEQMEITPANPLILPGEPYVYRVSGLYIYAWINPMTATTPLATGTTPAETALPSDHLLNPAVFQQGIITDAPPVKGPAPAPPTPAWQG